MTPVEPASLPIIAVTSTFLFVLLIILLTKAPKAGACVVSILLMTLPLAMLLGHWSWGPLSIPVFSIWATFLFVLLIILLARQPRLGAVLIVMLVVMGLSVLIFWSLPRPRHVASVEVMHPYLPEQMGAAVVRRKSSEDSATAEVVMREIGPGLKQYVQVPPSVPEPPVLPSVPPEPAAVSPIWSDAIEEEFRADVYASKLAAARAGGAQLARSIRQLLADVNSPPRVVVFQGGHEYQLIAELRDSIRRALPEATVDIEADIRSPGSDELGVTLYDNPDERVTHGPGGTALRSGGLDIHLAGRNGKVHVPVRFTEKPWVENFGVFANARPEQHFIVTRSRETCTSEPEARQQALDDARARLTEALGARSGSKLGPAAPPITPTDVLQGDFIVDQFAQSFHGTAGKIWREAMLLDVSAPKLTHLADLKLGQLHAQKMSWARMGLSALGAIVLIGVIYFFLNMATMGYYEWSLRIAGVILAIVAVIAILMIVQ
jgi:hypothetical protein